MSLLFYPLRKTDRLEGVATDSDRPVEKADPEEFFLRLLDECTTIIGPTTLIWLNPNIPGERKGEIEDRVIEYFRGTLDGLMVPRALRRLIRETAQQSRDPDVFGAYLNGLAEDVLDPDIDLPEALQRRAYGRVQLIGTGADGVLSEAEVSVCELAADLFLLQKAATLDVERAEDERPVGQTRGQWLEEELAAGGDSFYLDAVSILRRGSPDLEKGLRALGGPVHEWLRSRDPVWERGLLR